MAADQKIEDTEWYAQESEFQILKSLVKFLKNRTFIDVGAERGAFAGFLRNLGFDGVIFEPCPKHQPALEAFSQKTGITFFPYAIDTCDRMADLHIACDPDGNIQDYYHSLHYLENDPRVLHQETIPVECRSLDSLLREKIIPKAPGILKIDTEGNDFRVISGLGDVRPEVLICEFFTPGIYAGWEEANPSVLIDAVKTGLGYEHYMAIKRHGASELISLGPCGFFDAQWGNLIFMNDSVYQKAFAILLEMVVESEKELFGRACGAAGGATSLCSPGWLKRSNCFEAFATSGLH